MGRGSVVCVKCPGCGGGRRRGPWGDKAFAMVVRMVPEPEAGRSNVRKLEDGLMLVSPGREGE